MCVSPERGLNTAYSPPQQRREIGNSVFTRQDSSMPEPGTRGDSKKVVSIRAWKARPSATLAIRAFARSPIHITLIAGLLMGNAIQLSYRHALLIIYKSAVQWSAGRHAGNIHRLGRSVTTLVYKSKYGACRCAPGQETPTCCNPSFIRRLGFAGPCLAGLCRRVDLFLGHNHLSNASMRRYYFLSAPGARLPRLIAGCPTPANQGTKA